MVTRTTTFYFDHHNCFTRWDQPAPYNLYCFWKSSTSPPTASEYISVTDLMQAPPVNVSPTGQVFCIIRKWYAWNPDLIVLLRPYTEAYMDEIQLLSNQTCHSRAKSRFNIIGRSIIRSRSYQSKKSDQTNYMQIILQTDTAENSYWWKFGQLQPNTPFDISIIGEKNILANCTISTRMTHVSRYPATSLSRLLLSIRFSYFWFHNTS